MTEPAPVATARPLAPRTVINPHIYDITLLTPGLYWSGIFTRQDDPSLADILDHLTEYLTATYRRP